MLEPSDLQRFQQSTVAWARRAAEGGWLGNQDLVDVETIDDRLPETLFDTPGNRPLVVAFFGGTGVGKSTLLNRLAGQEIARTGVVRPTSREISAYLHESVKLRPLSEKLPIDKVRVITHGSERYRNVLWIDMPDFDSTDRSNHELALGWLPHIDVLIYVVSPERYRDDRGWRILLENERNHAWVFAINQWDRGHISQLEDFRKLLAQAGFTNPLIYRTDSRPEADRRKADELPELDAMITGLAERRVLEQLARHNLEGRLHVVTDKLAALLEKLGDDESFQRLAPAWERIWKDTSVKLWRGLEWPMTELAARFVQREGDPLRRSLNLTAQPKAENPELPEPPKMNLLWDEWTQLCFDDALDRLAMEADSLGLPQKPLSDLLRPLRAEATRTVLDQAQTALRQALARPGNSWQRVFLKLAGLVAVIAPLGAMGWVAYEVVVEYYRSVQAHTAFLGTDFAIHSILLITVSWALPYFLYRKLRPSAEKAAHRGLQQGVQRALDLLSARVAEHLGVFQDTTRALKGDGRHLIEKLPADSPQTALRPSKEPSFARLLATAK